MAHIPLNGSVAGALRRRPNGPAPETKVGLTIEGEEAEEKEGNEEVEAAVVLPKIDDVLLPKENDCVDAGVSGFAFAFISS